MLRATQPPSEACVPCDGSPLSQGGGLAQGQSTSVLSLMPAHYTNITVFPVVPDFNKMGNLIPKSWILSPGEFSLYFLKN